LAKRFKMSVSETTPVRRPEMEAPAMADAETVVPAGAEGRPKGEAVMGWVDEEKVDETEDVG
jgi:hypothetical protein